MQLRTNFISFGQALGDPQDWSRLIVILTDYNVEETGLDFPEFSEMTSEILRNNRLRHIVFGDMYGGDRKRRRRIRPRNSCTDTKQTSRALEVISYIYIICMSNSHARMHAQAQDEMHDKVYVRWSPVTISDDVPSDLCVRLLLGRP